jgi:hypothetical protein
VEETFAWGEEIIKFEHPYHYFEVKGIADTIGLTVAEGLTINYLYSIAVFCTSILARQGDGKIIHGRNQDYGWPDQMRADIFVADFIKGGNVVYSGIMFAGDTGIYTAEKNGAFSLSLNARHPYHDEHIKHFMENVVEIFEGWNQIGWLIREVF